MAHLGARPQVAGVLSWGEFRRAEPALAEAGRELLYHFGVGLAFLATVRRDGGPRLHPICPIVTDEGLYGLIIPSLKLQDLMRDGRFALHSYPLETNEDAFYLTGRAAAVEDRDTRDQIEGIFVRERPQLDATSLNLASQTLVEFHIDSCLLTRTTAHGDPSPRHTVWKAP